MYIRYLDKIQNNSFLLKSVNFGTCNLHLLWLAVLKDIVTGPVSSLGQVDDERESTLVERVVEVVVVVVTVLEQHLGRVGGYPRPAALVKPAHPPGYVDLIVKYHEN